eukprot:6017109-Pyramimonas_sp.AAC.1
MPDRPLPKETRYTMSAGTATHLRPSIGICSRRTNQTREAWVFSHDGPIRRMKCGYTLMMDQSNA